MRALEGLQAPRTVSAAFARAAGETRAALVGYLPAGFPSVPGAIAAATAMAEAGAHIVGVGLAHSHPPVDGPVIQGAPPPAAATGPPGGPVLHTLQAPLSP